MKIESLTPAQDRAMIEYRDKWLAIGRSTEPADRPKAEKAITEMYRLIGKPKPYFWWCDGPAVGSMVRTLLKSDKGQNRANLYANLSDNLRANLSDNLRDNLYANLSANLYANLSDNLRANLSDNLSDNLRANLSDNLSDNLYANLYDNLYANLRANLRANLSDNLRANLSANLSDNLRANLSDNLRANLSDNLSWYFWGQHESAWPAYYVWPHSALREMHSAEQIGKLSLWLDVCASAGWWQPHEGICFVCERLKVQAIDERGLLHKDGGPAILCRDGWPVYALHGIRVKEEYAVTPAENISPETVLKETNADVRRELLRKVGVERMLSKLPHKRLELRGNYELLSVDLGNGARDARYLKMLNPSVGVFHLEGVAPECDTVEKSLNWRNSQWFENAEQLT